MQQQPLIYHPNVKRFAVFVALAFIVWNVIFILSLRRDQESLQRDTDLMIHLTQLNGSINKLVEAINYEACHTHAIAREAVWITYFPQYVNAVRSLESTTIHDLTDRNRIEQVFSDLMESAQLNKQIVTTMLNGSPTEELIDNQNKILADALNVIVSINNHINSRQEDTSQALSEKWRVFTLLVVIWFILTVCLATLVGKYLALTLLHERIEASLLESETDLRTILENTAQHFILVDRTLRVKKFNDLVNKFIVKLNGRSLNVGDRIDHFYFPNLSLPSQRMFELHLRRALLGKNSHMEEQFVLEKKIYWFQLDFNPVCQGEAGEVTGVCITALNITLRKEAEYSLAKSEERFRSLVKHSTDIITILAPDGRITYSSSSIRSILGYRPEDLIGNSIFDFIAPFDRPLAKEKLALSLQRKNSVVTVEIHFRKPDNQWVVLECVANNLLHVDSIQGVVVIARDVTKRVQLEQELIQSKEAAEELSRLKSSFLANMSHEIRTPMTAVIGFAGVLTELLEVPEQREYAESILNSGTRLLNTINSILDLAKIESNRFEIHPKPTDVGTEVQHILLMLEPLARQKQLRLDFSIDEHFPTLSLDNHAFSQVLTNLIGNAIKFTKEGNVFVNLRIAENYYYVEVIDTGIGISPEFLPFVFDEFRQESGGLGRHFEGTGLGLAISKKIISLMGGEISVSSELGIGSSFRIMLPLSLAAPQPVPLPLPSNLQSIAA